MNLPFPDVQVAGIRDWGEAELLIDCGVKFLGFPLRLPVHKEDISEEDARDVISRLPAGVFGVLITYLDSAESIIELSDYLGVGHIQLHGPIDFAELVKLKNAKPRSFIIKSLVVRQTGTENLFAEAEKFETIVDAFITDTHDPTTGADGATGLTHDWEISKQLVNNSRKPVILAGGLDHSNVHAAIDFVRPSGVDSHTGVEDSSGFKDRDKVSAFVARSISAFGSAKVILPTKVQLSQIERAIDSRTINCGPRVGTITLDLRSVRFIEVSALVALVSFIEWRSSRALRTILLLPENKSVRDFMRLWGFHDAVKDCTGYPFSYFCTDEDIDKFFGENKVIKNFTYNNALSKVQGQLINDRFFSISTYPINRRYAGETITTVETERWKGPLIKEFLAMNLEGMQGAGLVSSRIVFEAMTNAIRHPGATLIIAASFCENKIDREKKRLTITFWDNGQSMIDTIGSALLAGRNVRSSGAERERNYVFDVRMNRVSGEQIFELATDIELSKDAERYVLFLACLFPGVSRDIERKSFIPSQEVINEEIEITEPGYGLTYLLNCAIDVFKGSVKFRTGNISAEISTAEDGRVSRYSARIEEHAGDWATFNGNLLTVELLIGGAL
ncbi:MAG: phosphoribosylanthranilate isomerase [Methylovulum sp.]|nr:phosphoribosylanthranilate isomerase [Methylovulum sp.]